MNGAFCPACQKPGSRNPNSLASELSQLAARTPPAGSVARIIVRNDQALVVKSKLADTDHNLDTQRYAL